ncbi:MAG: ribosome recycling factor [Parcubacteria group bacterium]|nr:ribosome recycling factor [Parcubacteria group bacterium]
MEFTQQLKQNQEHFILALKKLRTGRAHPDMVADISVEAYGAQTPLSGLASTSIQDARTLLVEPWDKNITKDIEKAIIGANRGLSASVSGSVVRASIPQMTQENRMQAVKSLKETLEKARVSMRVAREEEKKRIERAAKAGELTEDDRLDEIKRLDEDTKQAVAALESISTEKEKELMQL